MQLDKVLSSIGALVCTSLLGIGLTTKEVEAQTARPYVVFVNGQGNCCSWGMTSLMNRLWGMNSEIRRVPYSNFRDGGQSGGGNALDWSSVDSQFLKDGEDFLNNQLDKNRPLILIGHSYGGDSILKLLPRIKRRIQLVAVIDPVSTGGFRATLSRYAVPSNVDYFFNRWQENVVFPNDFGLNGSISCNARTCDQDSENIARNADSSPITTECRWDEFTCPGFVAPTPFRSGRKGTKQVRVGHQDLPRSAHIQQVLGDKIQARLAEFRPPLTPLYLYWNNVRGDNATVANPTSIREQQQSGYARISVQGCIFAEQQSGTIPLRLYWNKVRGDNATVANSTSIREQQQSGYVEVATQGYVYAEQQSGTVPLRLYWNNARGDNATVANPTSIREQQQSGYVEAATQGYVYPKNMCE